VKTDNNSNVIVPLKLSNCEVGDVAVFDKVTGKRMLVKAAGFNEATLPARYVSSHAAYVCNSGSKMHFISAFCVGDKNNSSTGQLDGSEQWAAPNEFLLTLDLTADGGFHWIQTKSGASTSGDVTWTAGAAIASVIAQLEGVTATALTTTEVEVDVKGYGTINFEISNNTGATLVDCSLSAKIGNGEPIGIHASFQGQSVNSIFPALNYPSAMNVCFTRNGFNNSYRSGVCFQLLKHGQYRMEIMNLSQKTQGLSCGLLFGTL
jgi:hypothetical protein